MGKESRLIDDRQVYWLSPAICQVDALSIDLNAIAVIGATQICYSASRPPGRDLAPLYVERELQQLLNQPGFAKAFLGVYYSIYGFGLKM
jgi:hypothetical protein